MPTFTIRYTPNAASPEMTTARDELAGMLVKPVSQMVPEAFNDVLGIVEPEVMFTPDDTFVGIDPFDERDHLEVDFKLLGAIPARVAQYNLWDARKELCQEVDHRFGRKIIELLSGNYELAQKAVVESKETELIHVPSCGIASSLDGAEVYATWGGPSDLKQ